MGLETNSEWCDSTVNPTTGCEGCELKRAQAALKNLRLKLRYYERVLTAAGKLPKTEGER